MKTLDLTPALINTLREAYLEAQRRCPQNQNVDIIRLHPASVGLLRQDHVGSSGQAPDLDQDVTGDLLYFRHAEVVADDTLEFTEVKFFTTMEIKV